jgi:predicted secreted protein with PEFG-CTERM motif
MDIRIFYILTILIVISSAPAFADESLISVKTTDSNYEEGDTILISGQTSVIIGDTQVILQLFKDGNLIEIAQIKISQDGNYSHTIIAEGPLWKNIGEYTIKATYGDSNVSETQFMFTPKSEIIETQNNFEVNAGDSGTFDVKYTIRGGMIEDIKIEPNIFGLIVEINALDDGTLVLELPRQFIDSEKQNGKDEKFIILIDDIQTTYDELKEYSEFRTITINFEQSDSKIQIIGTYVIPEFGTIVMIILAIGIMVSVLLTKNKFQIKI